MVIWQVSISLTGRSTRVFSSYLSFVGRTLSPFGVSHSFLRSYIMTGHRLPCQLSPVDNVETSKYGTVIVVAPKLDHVNLAAKPYFQLLSAVAKVDKSVEEEGTLVPLNVGSLTRLIYAPVHHDKEYDDVRSYADAAAKGVKRAISAGATDAVLMVIPDKKFPLAPLVTLLGALEELYLPIQIREAIPEKPQKLTELGLFVHGYKAAEVCKIATGLESGRFVARDLGGGDPERMAAPRFAAYVKDLFHNTKVSVEIIDDVKVFEKEYPMFAAVNRAANVVERHRGRIIFLRYTGEGPITKTLMPVGKGITYDTGGADVKAGGIMAGMSRDKCGASNVVGFFQTLVHFAPKNVKAIGALAVCRNSIGEECYVADEIITSRAGVRMRIGNTDAEGRMVMTDLLCKLKELALHEVNPQLMTIATLTGHACLAFGSYTAVMDNGPAKADEFAHNIQNFGELVGDMIEISTIRREDYKFVKCPKDADADLLQCNNKASSQTPRGHQFPAAFMILASGLDKHGLGSDKPLKYSHIDIAASSGHLPDTPTGSPILALAAYAYRDLLQFH